MATPTRAAASAGASLIPSPTSLVGVVVVERVVSGEEMRPLYLKVFERESLAHDAQGDRRRASALGP